MFQGFISHAQSESGVSSPVHKEERVKRHTTHNLHNLEQVNNKNVGLTPIFWYGLSTQVSVIVDFILMH